jgi:hypothetical protein
MSTPDELEDVHTLRTAVTRYDALRSRDSLADLAEEERDAGPAGAAPLDREEALELLALGEVIARKAGYGRQLAVRSARAAGASWAQVGAALGTTRQSAWEAHARWIEEQERSYAGSGYEGLDPDEATTARTLAGGPGS